MAQNQNPVSPNGGTNIFSNGRTNPERQSTHESMDIVFDSSSLGAGTQAEFMTQSSNDTNQFTLSTEQGPDAGALSYTGCSEVSHPSQQLSNMNFRPAASSNDFANHMSEQFGDLNYQPAPSFGQPIHHTRYPSTELLHQLNQGFVFPRPADAYPFQPNQPASIRMSPFQNSQDQLAHSLQPRTLQDLQSSATPGTVQPQHMVNTFFGTPRQTNSPEIYASPYQQLRPPPMRSSMSAYVPYQHPAGPVHYTQGYFDNDIQMALDSNSAMQNAFDYSQGFRSNIQIDPRARVASPISAPKIDNSLLLQPFEMSPVTFHGVGQQAPLYINPAPIQYPFPQTQYVWKSPLTTNPQDPLHPPPPPQQNNTPTTNPSQSPEITTGQRKLAFNNIAQAEAALAARMLPRRIDWMPGGADGSFPANDAAQAFYVRQLLEAIEDVSAAQDSTRHWELINGARYFEAECIEKVCWTLVSKAVTLHSYGPRVLAIYDYGSLIHVKAEQSLTFRERIDAICDLLRLTKNRCDRLMKGETLEIVVGAPKHLLSQSRTNKNSNGTKQGRIKKGVEIEIKEGTLTTRKKAPNGQGRSRPKIARDNTPDSPDLNDEELEDDIQALLAAEEASYTVLRKPAQPKEQLVNTASTQPSQVPTGYQPAEPFQPKRVTRSSTSKRTIDEVEDKSEEEELAQAPRRSKRTKRG
jgi:hypothetical protein